MFLTTLWRESLAKFFQKKNKKEAFSLCLEPNIWRKVSRQRRRKEGTIKSIAPWKVSWSFCQICIESKWLLIYWSTQLTKQYSRRRWRFRISYHSWKIDVSFIIIFLLNNSFLSISMKINRPLTAPKEKHLSKFESKLTIPGYKRPVSAKTHSLKQIIQVIENTLNRGAQTILTKAKTLDKFSKFKMQMDRVKKYKDRQLHDKDFPQYKTEFIIGNSQDFQNSSISIKSTKSIKYSHQHV